MIITRTPLRISFAGGGSDLPDFYKKYEGAVISTTIDKYVYVTIHPNFHGDKILLKYSKTEEVDKLQKIENDIARAVLSDFDVNGLEIEIIGDIPAKTGLGSSSSFAVGLYQSLHNYLDKKITTEVLAEKACHAEIVKLNSPIGKQDQYAAAYGGLNFYRFLSNGKVVVEPIKISSTTKKNLENNLLLFYTNITRSANTVLKEQKNNIKKSKETVFRLREMVKLAYEMKTSLEDANLDFFGELLNKGWKLKQSLARTITNKTINKYYELGLKSGALGGKLLGAGGGGCLLFYCEKKNQVKLKKALKNLRHIPFSFFDKGSEIIFQNK